MTIENPARVQSEGERLTGQHAAHRHRTTRCSGHNRIDIGVVPHIQRAGGSRPHGDAQQGSKSGYRVQVAGSDRKAHKRREHNERHHPWLHQCDVIADLSDRGLDARDRDAHRISGSVSY